MPKLTQNSEIAFKIEQPSQQRTIFSQIQYVVYKALDPELFLTHLCAQHSIQLTYAIQLNELFRKYFFGFLHIFHESPISPTRCHDRFIFEFYFYFFAKFRSLAAV